MNNKLLQCLSVPYSAVVIQTIKIAVHKEWSCNVFQEMFIYKINGLMYIFKGEDKINSQQNSTLTNTGYIVKFINL